LVLPLSLFDAVIIANAHPQIKLASNIIIEAFLSNQQLVDTHLRRHLELTIQSKKERALQTRDTLTEQIPPQFTDRRIPFDEPKAFPLPRRTLAVGAAWLIPGAGHLVLGRYGRALLFFITIVAAFVIGAGMDGHLYWPAVAEPPSTFHFDLITVLWFFAEIGSGLCYIVSYVLGIGMAPIGQAAASPTFEYGNTFMFLAGLLNYLVIHDAFDIAAGRKR
jgi:hypothetical protein